MKKIALLAVVSSLALASSAFAGDAKKHALATSKADAKKHDEDKKTALERARLEAHKKTGDLVADKNGTETDATSKAAANTEREMHARNVGAIERLQQIAAATNDGDLKTAVQRLSDKENKRHSLAAG